MERIVPTVNDNETAETLKKLRNILCLNQKEFAEKFHIPYSTYSQWETKRRQPPAYVVQLIVDIIEKDYLLHDSNQTSVNTDLGINTKLYLVIEQAQKYIGEKISNSEFKGLLNDFTNQTIPVRLHVGDKIIRGALDDPLIKAHHLHTVNSYEVCFTEWGYYLDICLNKL